MDKARNNLWMGDRLRPNTNTVSLEKDMGRVNEGTLGVFKCEDNFIGFFFIISSWLYWRIYQKNKE